MLIKRHSEKIIFAAVLLQLLLSTAAGFAQAYVTVRDVQIGTGGKFFRNGCWCPVKVVLESQSSGTEQTRLNFYVDNIEYAVETELRPASVSEIRFLVQIFSSIPDISWNLNGSPRTSYEGELNELRQDVCLVGVEEGIYDRFTAGFAVYNYRDSIKTFKFTFAELDGKGFDENALEPVDAIFAAEESAVKMPEHARTLLRKWMISGGNFILTDIVPDENTFFAQKRHFPGNPSVNGSAFGLIRRKVWPDFIVQEMPADLLLFILLTAALLVLLRKIPVFKKTAVLYRILQVLIIALFSVAFSFYACGRYKPELSAMASTSGFAVIDAKHGTLRRSDFAACYSTGRKNETFFFRDNAYFRPVFATESDCSGTRMRIVYSHTQNGFTMRAEDVFIPRNGYALFSSESAELLQGGILLKREKSAAEPAKMVVYNETSLEFRECIATDKNWILRIGALNPGGNAEIAVKQLNTAKLEDYIDSLEDKTAKNRFRFALRVTEEGRAVIIARLKPGLIPLVPGHFIEITSEDDICLIKL